MWTTSPITLRTRTPLASNPGARNSKTCSIRRCPARSRFQLANLRSDWLQLGLGTKPVSNEIIFTQGSFQTTGNPLDLVIQGNGFFQIHLSSGETAYTRAGQFQLDNNGNIVDSSGNMLEPQIAIPSGTQTITIATDGTVSVTLPNQTAAQVVGQIQLANFPNPAGLNGLGSNLYSPTDASGRPQSAYPAVRKEWEL